VSAAPGRPEPPQALERLRRDPPRVGTGGAEVWRGTTGHEARGVPHLTMRQRDVAALA